MRVGVVKPTVLHHKLKSVTGHTGHASRWLFPTSTRHLGLLPHGGHWASRILNTGRSVRNSGIWPWSAPVQRNLQAGHACGYSARPKAGSGGIQVIDETPRPTCCRRQFSASIKRWLILVRDADQSITDA